MEMLELILSNKASKDLNVLFDFILDPNHREVKNMSPGIQHFFTKVIFDVPNQFNSWTKALCIYCAWRNNEEAFIQKLSFSISPEDDYLVSQTRDFVKAKTQQIAV
jgi:hypothetical protein